MAYIIDKDKCLGCGACASQCPAEAIVPAGDKYEIVSEKCVDCGNCADVCPVGAIAKGGE